MKAYETHESSENYLESILMLSMDHQVVRSIDIANMLGFSKPSVSVAMKRLREEGMIVVDSNGYITLTDDGMKVAKGTYEKHIVITNMLVDLGVSPYTAGQDACRIEHVLSPETFARLKEFYLKSHNGVSPELDMINAFEQKRP
ncbi:metal-dependent transcriptional regulator [Oribacterium sp. WCC10]|uniref:metal-dependent transcriptional regulator n=1 Tax=Oribacterium sp. WCC10 TaxID=1855343 RepID=UPI0008E07141|nr:metal-dependent transcriptional regulator [Oribacterium sp. WCC10]SFG14036.1 Mn-dependent transcriptional regulator, DtxR family [Oribacterium sp. WCC10]